MINFRYHVVSIIGIFIALAVGVVLGAGPLQSRIQAGVSSSATTAAADPLLSAQADAEAAGLKALASSTLTGSLSSAKVALVVLPGASDDDVTAIRSTLTDAGASVVGRVTLTDNWQSTSMSQYRTTLSTTLASHLPSGAAKTASADGVVGYSIVQVLTTTGAETDLLRQILTDDSTPIMTVDEDANGSATAIVAVGPRAQAAAASNATPAAVTSSPDAWVPAVPLSRRLIRLARHSPLSIPPWRCRRPRLAPALLEWVTEHSLSFRATSKASQYAICFVGPR